MWAKTIASRPTQTQKGAAESRLLAVTQMGLTNAVWHSKTSWTKIKKNLSGKTSQMPPNQLKRKPTEIHAAVLALKMTVRALQTESAEGLNAKTGVVKSGES